MLYIAESMSFLQCNAGTSMRWKAGLRHGLQSQETPPAGPRSDPAGPAIADIMRTQLRGAPGRYPPNVTSL